MQTTLEELQGLVETEPNSLWYDDFIAAQQTPLSQLTVRHLKLLLRTQVGVEHVLPRALGMLEREPFTADWMYGGELLDAVLGLPLTYWHEHPDHFRRARTVFETVLRRSERKVADDDRPALHKNRMVRLREVLAHRAP